MKYSKKIIVAFLITALCACSLSIPDVAATEAIPAVPVTGNDNYYTYAVSLGFAVITGYLLDHYADMTQRDIPVSVDGYPVAWIGASAFKNSTAIRVTIPEGVTDIGKEAFSGAQIQNISLPESLKSIGDSAFSGTSKLEGIVLPEGLTTIGSGAFAGGGLKSVRIPASVTTIGFGCFISDFTLTTIQVDEANPVYADIGGVLFDKAQKMLHTFPGGKVGDYQIPQGTLAVADMAFYGSRLHSVTVPNSVTIINNGAFFECTSLKDVRIPDSVVQMGDKVFGSSPGVRLIVSEGSYAHQYALDNNLAFETQPAQP